MFLVLAEEDVPEEPDFVVLVPAVQFVFWPKQAGYTRLQVVYLLLQVRVTQKVLH